MLRRFDPDQTNDLAIERLLAGVFERRGQARAEGGLDPAEAPVGALRVAHPIAGRKLTHLYWLLHSVRIDRNWNSVDARRFWRIGASYV